MEFEAILTKTDKIRSHHKKDTCQENSHVE